MFRSSARTYDEILVEFSNTPFEIKTLNLNYSQLGDHLGRFLRKILPMNPHIDTLRLGYSGITIQGLLDFCHVCISSKLFLLIHRQQRIFIHWMLMAISWVMLGVSYWLV